MYVSAGPLNVRSSPSTAGALLGTQAINAQGTIIGGPTIADGYTWWNVNFDSGADGWAVENYLEIVQSGSNGTIRWLKQFGGTSADQGLAVTAKMLNGDVVVAGYFTNTADFGGTSLTSVGSSDMFLAKYTAAGALAWARRYGGDGSDMVAAVTVDADGNIVVTGEFWGTGNFGGDPLTSVSNTVDCFVAKYSSTGTHLWSRRLGGTYPDGCSGVAVDADRNIVVTGVFRGSVDFGGGPLTSTALGNQDTFVAKYDRLGTYQWARNFPSNADDRGKSVAVDGSGNVIVTGGFQGRINYGGGDVWSAGSYDVGVVKLTPAGTHVWSRRFGGVSDDEGMAVTVDGNGDVLMTGYFRDTMTMGATTLTSTGFADVFLAKLTNADGTPRWAKSFGGSAGDDAANGIAVSGDNNIALTGYFKWSANFGGNTLTSAGLEDIFTAQYTGDGAHLWSKRFGGVQDEKGTGLAVDEGNNVLVTGWFRGTTSFDDTTFTSAGSVDGFLVLLAGSSVAAAPSVQTTRFAYDDELQAQSLIPTLASLADILSKLIEALGE